MSISLTASVCAPGSRARCNTGSSATTGLPAGSARRRSRATWTGGCSSTGSCRTSPPRSLASTSSPRRRQPCARSPTSNAHQALHDALTGLGNRRKLAEDLEKRLEDRRHSILVLFDLNGFKQYNDAFGHPAGDALLQRLATKLQAALSDDAAAYRLGGDEFCVLRALEADADVEAWLSAMTSCFAETGEGFEVTTGHRSGVPPRRGHDTFGCAPDRRPASLRGEAQPVGAPWPSAGASPSGPLRARARPPCSHEGSRRADDCDRRRAGARLGDRRAGGAGGVHARRREDRDPGCRPGEARPARRRTSGS